MQDFKFSTRCVKQTCLMPFVPIPLAVRSKAWVCGRSLARIAGSNAAGGKDVCLKCVLCFAM